MAQNVVEFGRHLRAAEFAVRWMAMTRSPAHEPCPSRFAPELLLRRSQTRATWFDRMRGALPGASAQS